MKQMSRKTVLLFVGLAVLAVAGTAAAASVVAPAMHLSGHGPAGSLHGHFGLMHAPGEAPVDTPHSHGGCGWHHSGDGW